MSRPNRPTRLLVVAIALLVALAAAPAIASADGTLTVSKSPGVQANTVTGTVPDRTDGGPDITVIDCGSDCAETVTDYETCIPRPTGEVCSFHSEVVTLTAAPASGWSLSGWTGCSTTPSDGSCHVTMNADKSVTAQFVDTAAPTVTLTGPVSGSRLRVATPFGATAGDNWGVGRVDFLANGVAFASDTSASGGWGGSLSLAGFAQGATVGVVARAFDLGGNSTDSASRSYTIDREAGAHFEGATPPSGAFVSAAPQFDFAADASSPSDAGATFGCRVSFGANVPGPFSPCSSGYVPVLAADGPYAVDVEITDPAGNTVAISRNFNLDRAAPALQFSGGPGEGSTVNSQPVTFSFSAADSSPLTAECSLDGSAFSPCTTPTSFTADGLAPGGHTLAVRARDAAGNTATITRRFAVSSPDTTAPGTAIRGLLLKAARRRAILRFTGTDPAAESLPLRFQCRLDRRPWRGCRAPRTFRNLRPGRHLIRVRAIDAAGNVDPTPAKRRFRLADAGP